MSVENVHAFRRKVEGRIDLQRQISAHVDADQIDEVVALGQREGFDFSVGDLNSVFGGYFSGELSPAQLETVVGGLSGAPGMTTFELNLLQGAPPLLQQKCSLR